MVISGWKAYIWDFIPWGIVRVFPAFTCTNTWGEKNCPHFNLIGNNWINLAFVQSLCIELRVSSAASVLLWSELICIDLPTIDLYWSDLYHQSWNHQLSVCSPDAGIWTLGPTEPWSRSPFLDLSICFNFIFVFVYLQHFYSGQCWVQPNLDLKHNLYLIWV